MVSIPHRLLSNVMENIEKHMPNETGGVIAGELIGKSQWIITHITMPGPKASHNRSSFKPDQQHDENEIARIYQETNCNSVYLGDWHSHPGSHAYMSEKDKNTLRNIGKSKVARMPYPIMLIMGTSPFELRCWNWQRPKLTGKEFTIVPVVLLKTSLNNK